MATYYKQKHPNYEMLYVSTLASLKDTYSKYKNAAVECIKWTFVNDDGEFTVLEGYDERAEKAKELHEEVLRLRFRLKELKECMS